MIELSIKDFVKTLTNIFKSSPTSIIFIIAGLIFAIAMIINIKRKKTIGWPLYIIGWFFIIAFIIIKYNNYLLSLFDNLINNIFTQILFPNLGTYVIIIIISNIIYIYSTLKKEKKPYEKIINYIFFTLIMLLMIYTLEQIIENKLNIYNLDIYQNQKILILVETTTVIFVIWMIFLISKKIIKKLINISNKKIEKNKSIQNIENKNISNIKQEDKSKMPTENIQQIETNVEINETPSTKQTEEIIPAISNQENLIFSSSPLISPNPAIKISNTPSNNQVNISQKANNLTENNILNYTKPQYLINNLQNITQNVQQTQINPPQLNTKIQNVNPEVTENFKQAIQTTNNQPQNMRQIPTVNNEQITNQIQKTPTQITPQNPIINSQLKNEKIQNLTIFNLTPDIFTKDNNKINDNQHIEK